MLNHSLMGAMRTSIFRGTNGMLTAADDATRRFGYENLKVHNIKYRSQAKERRKAIVRARQGGQPGPREIGEEQPPFFMPVRYRLLVKCYQESRNSNRFTRKPMPDAVRLEFAKRSKEYQQYKHHEVTLMNKETDVAALTHVKALEACLFLPDYLLEETFNESGAQTSEAMEEF